MKKVLLVEDDEFIRYLYKRQLELDGLSTDEAATGNIALELLAQNRYEIILLDIMLPDINGIEILRKIKQDARLKDIPVVLLTNLGQEEIIKEGFNLGAIGYLIKASFTPNQIVQEVKNLMQNAQQEVKPASETK